MDDKSVKNYENPVPYTDGKRRTAPDPFILRWCGKYYCYATDENGVKVSVSEDLVRWEDRGYALEDAEFRDFWAPSVFYRNGIFYMYYSNIPVDEKDVHEQHLKLAVSADPEKGFCWKKTFFQEFSIDSHPVFWNGQQYMFYSVNNWIGTDEKITGTCILVDRMRTPEEFMGEPRAVVLPTLPQEIYEENRFGDGRDWYTIEGAAHVVRGKRFWLMYSANAYVNVDYFVGTAVAECRPELMDMEWKKYPDAYTWRPLLCKNEKMEGTGHNTVTKAPNLTDEWIVYHARKADEALIPGTEQREMCIDPLYFNGDELLCFGPSASGEAAPASAQIRLSECRTDRTLKLADGRDFYLAELWVSAGGSHAGAKYGVMLEYTDEGNWFELVMHTGRRELQAVECRENIKKIVGRKRWEADYDYTVPHMMRIEKIFDLYRVSLDDGSLTEIRRTCAGSSTVQLVPHFTCVDLHSFALTETVCLEGEDLEFLGMLGRLDPCVSDGTGIIGRDRKHVTMRKDVSWESYTEVIQAERCSRENSFSICREESRLLAENMEKEFSVYHIVRGENEKFIVDGKQTEWIPFSKGDSYEFSLDGLKILEYQITKN